MTSMSGLRQSFPQENGVRPIIQHAWRVRRAADCLRFASLAEATGGLELGDLELGGLEEAWNRLGRGLQEAWKRLGVPRGSGLGSSNFMKNDSQEGSGRLKRPKLHAKSAKRKARKAKEAPKMTKLIPQKVPRPPQDASFGSLGSDFWVFLEEKLPWSWKLWI